jgi:hypothetical protein
VPKNSIRTDTTLAAVANTAFAFAGTRSARLSSTSENIQPGLACGNGHQLTADTQWGATYPNGKIVMA